MQRYPARWAIAGGWALDLGLGTVRREHADLDLAVFRANQSILRAHLANWRWEYASGGALRPWGPGDWLALPVHELYATATAPDTKDARLEFLLNEQSGADWIFRRDSRVRLPLSRAILTSPSGWIFDRRQLLYGHTVVALVPAEVTGNEPELVEFDSLKHRHPMIRFAVVYNRGVEPRDTAYLNPPPWLRGAARGFASDSQIIATFAPRVRDSSDKTRRYVLNLPSFLVVSDSGKVLARAAGPPLATLGPVLDSLRAIWDSRRQAEGNAHVASARPRLERGLRTFDPVTLVDSTDRVRLDGTCSGEETVERGIVPAVVRLIDIRARHPGVVTTLEITSIADVIPVDDDQVYRTSIRVIPKIETRRYRVDFFENAPDATGQGDLYTDFSIEPVDEDPDRVPRALIPLGDSDYRKLEFPDGITLQDLLARIDSIRKAAR